MNNSKETNKVTVDSYGCFGRSDPIEHIWDRTGKCWFWQSDREELSELSSTGVADMEQNLKRAFWGSSSKDLESGNNSGACWTAGRKRFWQSKGKADVRSWKGWQEPDHVTCYMLQSLVSIFVFQKPGLRHLEKCFVENRGQVNVWGTNVNRQILDA